LRAQFLFLAVLVAFAAPAAAQSNANGAFAGAAFGASKFHNDCAGSCDTSDAAVRLFGGYRFDENFAAELGYSDLGKADLAGTSIGVTVWDLSLLGILPVGQNFSLLGRIGFFRSTADVSGGRDPGKVYDTGNTWGFGVQYDLNETLAVRGEWQRYDKVSAGANGDGNIDRLAIAVLWRFR